MSSILSNPIIDLSKSNYNQLVLLAAKKMIKDELDIANAYYSIIINYNNINNMLSLDSVSLDNILPYFSNIDSAIENVKEKNKTIYNDNINKKIKDYRNLQIVISQIKNSSERVEYLKQHFGSDTNIKTSSDIADLIVKENLTRYKYNRDSKNIQYYQDLFQEHANIKIYVENGQYSEMITNINNFLTKIINILRYHESEAKNILEGLNYDYNELGRFRVFKANSTEVAKRSSELVLKPGMLITPLYEVAISGSELFDPNFNIRKPYIYKGPLNPTNNTVTNGIDDYVEPEPVSKSRQNVFDTTGYYRIEISYLRNTIKYSNYMS